MDITCKRGYHRTGTHDSQKEHSCIVGMLRGHKERMDTRSIDCAAQSVSKIPNEIKSWEGPRASRKMYRHSFYLLCITPLTLRPLFGQRSLIKKKSTLVYLSQKRDIFFTCRYALWALVHYQLPSTIKSVMTSKNNLCALPKSLQSRKLQQQGIDFVPAGIDQRFRLPNMCLNQDGHLPEVAPVPLRPSSQDHTIITWT